MSIKDKIYESIETANELWLLLDYDGTLADFAPTPDHVIPDPELIGLIRKLAHHPKIRIAVISGRRLSHIEKLVPVEGIWLFGSYGLEMRLPSGERIQRAAYPSIRPDLDRLKPAWAELIEGQEGFYLEDKGWSLALHARFASDDNAAMTLEKAKALAQSIVSEGVFSLLGGDKFLEVAPHSANKGKTVRYLLDEFASPSTLPIYIGDDDKDEAAFPVVQSLGGIAGCVGCSHRASSADFFLSSPKETRRWLANLPAWPGTSPPN